MERLVELLFLKNLKGIGNVIINKKYATWLKNNQGLDNCVAYVEERELKLSSLDIKNAKEQARRQYVELINAPDIEVITIFDKKYPSNFHALGDKKPVILYVKGHSEILEEKNIAIVGTRNPSEWSKLVVPRLIQKIVEESNRVIVSGLALGCDALAHENTVEIDAKTIAVLPSGLNVITPAANRGLARKIVETGGCLITEYVPNAKVTKSTYVERDALIAALSDATFVIECAVKSGTMHTVNAAKEMGKKIACYYPKDLGKGNYNGNVYLINEQNAIPISDTSELLPFLNFLNEKTDDNVEQIGLFED